VILEKNARGVEKRGFIKKLKDGYAKEVPLLFLLKLGGKIKKNFKEFCQLIIRIEIDKTQLDQSIKN
jgi:hypothetical protein